MVTTHRGKTESVSLTSIRLYLCPLCWRRDGRMANAHVLGAGGPGSSQARDTVLCSWARHFTLTVPLSTQEYKWVQANRWET